MTLNKVKSKKRFVAISTNFLETSPEVYNRGNHPEAAKFNYFARVKT